MNHDTVHSHIESDKVPAVPYRPDIDGLRALAVLAVVGFHAFPTIFRGGYIGVDIFFVISGFLISGIILKSIDNHSFSFLEFYSRRIRRIFPALVLVLAAGLVLGWYFLLAPELKQLGKHIAGGAGFISNFILWGESGYFDSSADNKPLLHLWSLGIEEQFYILWPLLLWLMWKTRVNFVAAVTAITLLSFLTNVAIVEDKGVAAFYSPITRIWELLLGAVLAYCSIFPDRLRYSGNGEKGCPPHNRQRRTAALPLNGRQREILSVSGLTLILLSFLLLSQESVFPGWLALLPTCGTVFILAAGENARLNRYVLSHPVAVWFGLISYPLYLWHWLLLSYAHLIGVGESVKVRGTAVALSIMLAWLTFLFIERPVRYGRNGRQKTIALACLMALIGGSGGAVYWLDGLGNRFPPIIREITEFTYDFEKEYRQGSCFLLSHQSRRDFDTCGADIDPAKKTVLLWGDSYAAHLYPGYRAVYGDDINIIQRTASLCPPILGEAFANIPHCKAINGSTLLLAKEIQPDIIILAGHWAHYEWKNVSRTVAALRQNNMHNIILVGPVPHWNDSLPKQLYRYFSQDIRKRVPNRMHSGVNYDILHVDYAVAQYAKNELQVNYVSPYKILCNEDGCMTRVGDAPDQIVAWDYGHLTTEGSRFVVENFIHDMGI